MKAVSSIPVSMKGEGGAASARACVSGGHTTDAQAAQDVVFFRLGKKFVDNERSIPEDVRSVLYYTLAIGHHTGVIDCLDPRIATSRGTFSRVLAALPEGQAREKLAGVERFGEIQIDKEHVPALREAALGVLARANDGGDAAFEGASPQEEGVSRECVRTEDVRAWLEEFVRLIEEVACEPQVYAVGRRVTR